MFYSKSSILIKKNLDYLACFSYFLPKKWWISEKEFKSHNIGFVAIGADPSSLSIRRGRGSGAQVLRIALRFCFNSSLDVARD